MLTFLFDQVLRYSALAFGVFYGFSHQRSITASQKAAAAQKEWAHKQQLIEQARSQYAESKNPKAQSSQKSPRTFSPSFYHWQCQKRLAYTPQHALYVSNEILTSAVIVDQNPMDPKFDLEAYLVALDKQSA